MLSSVLPPMTRIDVTGPLRSLAPIVKMPLVPCADPHEQVRFVDPVDACPELVAEAGARHRPRKVVAELPLRLLGALWRHRARAGRDTVREPQVRPECSSRECR